MNIPELRQRHPDHWMRAAALRVLAMDAVQKANSGHPGMPMGMADVATVLFGRHLKFDAERAGLAGPRPLRAVGRARVDAALRAAVPDRLSGDDDRGDRELPPARVADGGASGIRPCARDRDDDGAARPGPRERGRDGDGRAEPRRRGSGGRSVDHHTWVIAGDGCLMEGISHEAIGLAGRQKLSKLIVFWDDNGISIDGKVHPQRRHRPEGSGSRPPAGRCMNATGTIPTTSSGRSSRRRRSEWPAMIDCHTHIGFGAPDKQDTKAAHGSPLGAEEIAKVREIYGWPYPPFEVPNEIVSWWRGVGARGGAARTAWEAQVAKLPAGKQAEFRRQFSGELPKKLGPALLAVPQGAVGGGGEGRDAQVVGAGARGRQRGGAGDARRLGRPDRLEQHADQGPRGVRSRQPGRALCPLRHPRARDGRGDERARGARRGRSPTAGRSWSSATTRAARCGCRR